MTRCGRIVLALCLFLSLLASPVQADPTIGDTSGCTQATCLSGTTFTMAHVVASGEILVVSVRYRFNALSAITAVTYSGSAMTAVGSCLDDGTSDRLCLYKHLTPAVGTANVVVTVDDATSLQMGVIASSWSLAADLTNYTTAGPTTDQAPTITVTSASGDVGIAVYGGAGNPTEQDTLVLEINPGAYDSMQRIAGAGTVVLNWTTGAPDSWIVVGANITAAAAAGGGSRLMLGGVGR